MPVTDKPLVWLRGEIKSPPFSADARLEAGVLLRRLQRGERASDSRKYFFAPEHRAQGSSARGLLALEAGKEIAIDSSGCSPRACARLLAREGRQGDRD